MLNMTPGKNQLNEFAINGFTIIKNAIPATLLTALRNLFEEKIQQCTETEITHNLVGDKSYVSNIEYLFKSNNLACLELLGLPLILETAESICGPNFFLIQEFAVIKMLGDTTEVLWHQDMLHRRTGNCFIMGIYLDDANTGDGCLRIIPQSHTSGKDICTLKQEPYIEVAAKAGDILIHDMMLAHSSGIMKKNNQRRVLYFEFLSYKQAIEENIYTQQQVYNRLRLVRLAAEYYHRLHPGHKKFNWQNRLSIPAETTDAVQKILADIHQQQSLAKPSAYCFS